MDILVSLLSLYEVKVDVESVTTSKFIQILLKLFCLAFKSLSCEIATSTALQIIRHRRQAQSMGRSAID